MNSEQDLERLPLPHEYQQGVRIEKAVKRDPRITAIFKNKPAAFSKTAGPFGVSHWGHVLRVFVGQRTEIWQDGQLQRVDQIDASCFTSQEIDVIGSVVKEKAMRERFIGKIFITQVRNGAKHVVRETNIP